MTRAAVPRHLSMAEIEAIVSRFDERVNAAQQASPPSRELVRKALRRQATRCPVRIRRLSYDVIVRHGDALADLFCAFPDDAIFFAAYDITVGHQPPDRPDRLTPIRVLMQEAEWTDEWGTRWAHAAGGMGATQVANPIEDWRQLDGYLATRVPDPRAPGRLDAARAVVEAHGRTRYCVGMIHLALFERLHSLRGMQNTFVDFHTHEREVRRLLDALAEYLLELIRAWGKLGADALFLTDDWGTQLALMIAPDMWRRYFKAHYRRIFDEVHRCGMDVIFHSCGNVTAIVPDLIDIGLDVLDPVQPGAMDVAEVARRFGGQLSFCGAIDDQRLGSSSPRQIKDAVRRTVGTLGRPFGNGLILAPANLIPPEVPIENLQALFEACHDSS